MPEDEDIIETGVDKLVRLVKERNKVSTGEAAKLLGVTSQVIDEWCEFLEQEGVISVEYKLATKFLVSKKMTKGEIKQKAKEFHSKKDLFQRKAEVTLSLLDRDSEDFQQLRQELIQKKGEIDQALSSVQGELRELERYEELKRDIDKRLAMQQDEFKQKLKEINIQVLSEHKKYQEIIDHISNERQKLEVEMSQIGTLEQKEKAIRENIALFEETIKEVKRKVSEQEGLAKLSENRIRELDKLAKRVKLDVDKRRSAIDEVIEKEKEHERKIIQLQENVINKLQKKEIQIDAGLDRVKGVSDRFKEFFDKKTAIDNMIDHINTERNELRAQLIELIRKARAFEAATAGSDLGQYAKQLEVEFNKLDKKRYVFEEELTKLKTLVK